MLHQGENEYVPRYIIEDKKGKQMEKNSASFETLQG